LLGGHLQESEPDLGDGAVDQNVDAAEGFLRFREGGEDLVLARDVGCECDRRTPSLLDGRGAGSRERDLAVDARCRR
jgi:hypothetical protein